PRDGVSALVLSYVDWVADQPEWARYQFNARFVAANGPHKEELVARNRARNQQLQEWFARAWAGDKRTSLPYELVPSLTIGPAGRCCRAWLSGRVASRPRLYRGTLAEAAWRALGVA